MIAPADLFRLGGCTAVGALLGAANLAALCVNTRLYLSRPLAAALPLHLARLAVVTAMLVLLARQGAGPLLAAGLGLLAVRPLAIRALGGWP